VRTPKTPLSLRTSGHLLLGLSKIFAKKVQFLLTDSSEAYHRLQMHLAKTGDGAANAEGGAGAKGKGKRGGGADDIDLGEENAGGANINMTGLSAAGGGGIDLPDLGDHDELGDLNFGGDDEFMDANAGAPGSAARRGAAGGSGRGEIRLDKLQGRASHLAPQRERTYDDVSCAGAGAGAGASTGAGAGAAPHAHDLTGAPPTFPTPSLSLPLLPRRASRAAGRRLRRCRRGGRLAPRLRARPRLRGRD